MWIMDKKGYAIFNSENINNFYIATVGNGNDPAIRASFSGSNKDLTLANYKTSEECMNAMKMLSNAMKTETVFFWMPSDSDIRAYANTMPMVKEKLRNGKKTKGHGGS